MLASFKSEPSEPSSWCEEESPTAGRQRPFRISARESGQAQGSSGQHRWNSDEVLNYLAFLESSGQQESERPGWAYFKRMSSFVGSRNPNQCRIKHLHMLKLHHSNPSILKAHQNQILKSEPQYDLLKERTILGKENCSNLGNRLQTDPKDQHQLNRNSDAYQESIDKFYEVFYPKLKNSQTDIALNEAYGDSVKNDKHALQSTADDYFKQSVQLQENSRQQRRSFNLSF